MIAITILANKVYSSEPAMGEAILSDDKLMLDGQSHDQDIFSIEPVQLQFSLVDLLSLKVCCNVLVLALKNGLIYRIDLNNPEFIDKIDLFHTTTSSGASNAYSNKIKSLFLDPTGNHLIISTVKNVHFYLNKASNSPILLNKFKSLHISYIHWNVLSEALSANSARNFLVGTSTGQIYESTIEFKPTNNKISNTFLKHVWRNPINSNNTTAVDGIFIKHDDVSKQLIGVVIQSDDIFYYKCIASKLTPTKSNSVFSQLLSNSYSDYEKLDDLGSVTGNKFISNYEDFAWLTKSGIVFTTMQDNDDVDGKLLTKLNYLLNIQLPENRQPIDTYSVLLSKYHIIYLRNNELIVINKINQQIVFHKFLPVFLTHERFLGICADYQEQTYWVYSNYNIYELVANNEGRDVWKIYLKNNQFDNALTLVESNFESKQALYFVKDMILSKKSDYLLNEKQEYTKAAETYAHTSRPFESVALSLLNKDESLLKYLRIKLALFPTHVAKFEDDEFYIQKVLLGSWIVEIYMERLNKLENDISINANEKTNVALTDVKVEFREFLNCYKNILHKETVYQILQSHNDQDHLLFFANMVGDYDFMLNYWINLENWNESLKILEKKNEPGLIYKYSNILLLNSTEKTLKLWTKLYQDLDYRNFAPALLTYNSKISLPIEKNPILNYLEFLIFHANAVEAIIHNIYLSVLVMYSNKKAETLILKYLECYNDDIHFEPDFILRLFLKFETFKPAVHIYAILGEYENAIDLSLQHHYLDLACLIADRSFENDVLRKKLWLKIAEKMVNRLIVEKIVSQNKQMFDKEDFDQNLVETIIKNDTNFKKFMADRQHDKTIIDIVNHDDDDIKNLIKYLLSKCELLSIKDILPLFPNFTSINNFKVDIIKSLESYGLKINQLNHLINNSINFNKKLIQDLEKLKESRYYMIQTENRQDSSIKNNSSCKICQNSIFLKKFIVFPCQHCFHIDCLANFILNSSNKKNYKLKKSLISQLQKNKVNVKNTSINDNNNKIKINNTLRISKELEEILSAKCVLCSDLNIESIDEPFINSNSNDDKKLVQEWDL